MNSFGRIFRISILGESHGPAVGVVIDGCPAGIPLAPADFEYDLGRRKSGAKGTTPRIEEDLPNLLSGLFNGFTTGAPITILFENRNVRSSDYSRMRDMPRPGHADFVSSRKFGGYQDYRGGGHFSGRLTLALVAAGVVAKKLLDGMSIAAHLIEAGGMKDIEKAVEQMKSKGVRMGHVTRDGILDMKCSRVAYFNPEDTGGVLLEFVEPK
jgi:chorismate synthase